MRQLNSYVCRERCGGNGNAAFKLEAWLAWGWFGSPIPFSPPTPTILVSGQINVTWCFDIISVKHKMFGKGNVKILLNDQYVFGIYHTNSGI